MESIAPEALLQHGSFVRSLARSLIGDEQLAEDIAQETLLVALERPPLSAGALRTWLARVTRNFARQAYRGSGRRALREAAVARAEGLPSAAEIVEREAARKRVVEAVLSLDDPYRSAVLLRFYEECPPREIARRMGVPSETARTWVKRGLVRLRERLDADHGGNRRAWAIALAPIAFRPSAGSLRPLVRHLPKAALATAAVAIVLVAFGAVGGSRDRVAPGPTPDAPLGNLVAAAAVAPADATPARAAHTPDPNAALAESAGSLLVRLVWLDGTPASRVGLAVFPENGAEPMLHVAYGTTAQDGTYFVPNVAAGSVHIWPDRGDRKSSRATHEIVAGRRNDVTIELPPGYDVNGVAVDRDGRPVPKAEIWLSLRDDATAGAIVARADAAGRFRVEGLSDFHMLAARAEGLGVSGAHRIGAHESSPISVELRIDHTWASVTGRLLDREGKPVAEACVLITPVAAAPATLAPAPNYLRTPPSSVPVPPIALPAPSVRAASGADGRFVASGVAAGEATVTVAARGFAPWRQTMTVSPSGEPLEVSLDPGVRLRGVVRRPGGEPAVGATVVIDQEASPEDHAWCTVDSSGEFRFESLASGSLVAHAFESDGKVAEARFAASAGEEIRWDPALVPSRAISGRVIDGDGAGLASWRVVARTLALPNGWTGVVLTEPDGRFAIANAPDEPLRVEVSDPDAPNTFAVAAKENVRAGEDVTLRVPDEARAHAYVTGSVVDADGRPVAPARVILWQEGNLAAGGHGRSTSESSGAFRIGPVPAGRYVVEVAATGHPTHLFETRSSVGSRETLDLGVLQLELPGGVEASFSRDDGAPPGGFVVSLHDAKGFAVRSVRAADAIASSPATRSARFDDLAPGRYSLRVRGAHVVPLDLAFEVRAHETTPLAVALEACAATKIRFAAQGAIDPEAHLAYRITDAKGRELWRAETEAGKPLPLDEELGLAPGRYRVDARFGSSARGEAAFEVPVAADLVVVALR